MNQRDQAPTLHPPKRLCNNHGPSWLHLDTMDSVQFSTRQGSWILLEAVLDRYLQWSHKTELS